MTELFLKIHGAVHGVGFRYQTKRFADGLGLVGWVKNAPDGTVELCGQGDKLALEKLASWIENFAPGNIDKVEAKWRDPKTKFMGFEIID